MGRAGKMSFHETMYLMSLEIRRSWSSSFDHEMVSEGALEDYISGILLNFSWATGDCWMLRGSFFRPHGVDLQPPFAYSHRIVAPESPEF